VNATSTISPVITADNQSLQNDFPLKPFAIHHKLSGHPLLTLPRIAQLASEMPRDLIEYNSGDAAISQDPDKVKGIDLNPVEIVNRIQMAGAWMVLKRIENSPEYRALLVDALTSVARARGYKNVRDAGFEQIEGFLFVSSPNSTTPFHMDAEDNFFVQIHGEKFFRIYDNRDGSIADEAQVEHSTVKHRNVKYDESFKPRGVEFHLFDGDGCYVPYQWPHWVRTAASYSISMAITWKTKEVRRLNDLHRFNSMLRGVGLPQAAPGTRPAFDSIKLAAYRSMAAAVQPLRSSEAMRRIIRRIALGKNANYYLKKA
jgi:Cupin superfamily protein